MVTVINQFNLGEQKIYNNDNYKGQWANDMFNGQGEYRWASGDVYNGEWKSNKRTGKGTIKKYHLFYQNKWGNIYRGLA